MGLGDRTWLFEADALIRGYLHQNPDDLDDNDWISAVLSAAWLESRYFSNLSKIFS